MIALAPPAGAHQAAFTIARCLLAHALDYDASVLPSSMLLHHAGVLDEAVMGIIGASMFMGLDDLGSEARLQISLPTRFAGLQVVLPTHIIPLAWAARLIELGPAVRAEASSWARDGDVLDPKEYDGVEYAIQDGILDLLVERGVEHLGGGGGPEPCS